MSPGPGLGLSSFPSGNHLPMKCIRRHLLSRILRFAPCRPNRLPSLVCLPLVRGSVWWSKRSSGIPEIPIDRSSCENLCWRRCHILHPPHGIRHGGSRDMSSVGWNVSWRLDKRCIRFTFSLQGALAFRTSLSKKETQGKIPVRGSPKE